MGRGRSRRSARRHIDLLAEGIGGLRRLGGIANGLLTRQGGCAGCAVQGTCGTCMPLVQLYRQAKSPLERGGAGRGRPAEPGRVPAIPATITSSGGSFTIDTTGTRGRALDATVSWACP
jgi:hypothetical protein